MEVRIDKTFAKDVERIREPKILAQIVSIIEEIISASSLQEIRNLKKLSLGRKHYRIRVGNYRIGLVIEKNIIHFVRVLPRKDLYKYFP